jgi:ParB family chromosome partitioning protein
MPIDRISPNPEQPRQHFDEDALRDLAASIREHGVLQPVLVRPLDDRHYQIVAGERRWRGAKLAGLTKIPVIVEQIDEEAALEIAIIENLQREDISPLEEAEMFERMTKEHGYSLRKLATKLGKDKGYVENRLRIARAPDEIKELVAVRSDTLSHAYELMKLDDPRKRKRLAKQVATGELSLVKLKQRIEGKPAPPPEADPESAPTPEVQLVAVPVVPDGPAVDAVDIDQASVHLDAAVKELIDALQTDPALAEASNNERQQFAKYLTVARIKLDNAIAVVRAGEAREPVAANYAESSE